VLIHLKLPSALHDRMIHDLERPHAHAYERVGFLFVKKGTLDSGNLLLLAAEYQTVRDENYIDDPYVGAKINSAAIRSAMERAMICGYGIIHIHLHNENYSSAFSKTDRIQFDKLIHSFHNIGGDAVHGAAVISGSRFTAFVLLRKNDPPVQVSRMTIVGHHITDYIQERSMPWAMTGTAVKAS